MVAVGSARGAVVEAVDHDIRLPFADGPYDIGEHFLFVPDLHRLVRVLGEPKIVGTAEHLLPTIYPAGG